MNTNRQQCVAVHCGQKPETSATRDVGGNFKVTLYKNE